MSATLNLSDDEVVTLYDLLVQYEGTVGDGSYANDIESMREKVERQL